MKLLQLCALFKLPDDFDGTYEDAVRLFADYFVASPRLDNPERYPQDNVMAAWADAWPGFTEDTAIRVRSCQRCMSWENDEWKVIGR